MARRTVDEAFRSHSALRALGGNRLAELEMARLRALRGSLATALWPNRLIESEVARLSNLERNSLAESEMARLRALRGSLATALWPNRLIESEVARLSVLERNSLAELPMELYDTGELIRYHEERRILIDNMGSLDNLLVHVREEQNALALSRLPTIEETLRLSTMVTEKLDAGLGSVASTRQEELRRLAEGISTPWVDKFNALSSFESVALLSSVGDILHGDPFDSVTSKALRAHLGDWSQTSFPQSILSDYQARELFFRDHGFDSRLTAIPEPAFTDFLDETGISHPDLFPPVPPPTEEPEAKEFENDEHLVRQRNLDAYDILFSLETQLREYLHTAMADHYGQKWEKQQVPNKLRQEWETKRAKAIEKGEGERPLLWYADFTDYVDIICQRNNWRGIFQPVFRNEVEIRASFQRLHPIRIPIMHARVITKDDILLLTIESRRILKAIEKLEDD